MYFKIYSTDNINESFTQQEVWSSTKTQITKTKKEDTQTQRTVDQFYICKSARCRRKILQSSKDNLHHTSRLDIDPKFL